MTSQRATIIAAALFAAAIGVNAHAHQSAPLVKTCNVCHGASGVATQAGTPNLAGQKAGYLRQQLHDFRSRVRVNALMNEAVAKLTDQDVEALAAYYSALPLPAASGQRSLDPTSRPLIFCVRCHGADGVSPNDIWPSLAGQSLAYMQQQMKAYASGERIDPMMAMWGRTLTPEQLQTVLEYFHGLGRASTGAARGKGK